MSRKDPIKSKIYLIRKKGGYIVAVEGGDEYHLEDSKEEDRKTIDKLKRLLEDRAKVGVKISKLLINELGLSTSQSFATHTTGAGDYDEQPKPKKK